ncbi:Uncharacterised protein g5465 [Pycnogonum litorale]
MAPSFGVMGNTVTLTVVTSTLIIVSMLTDHWEYVDFDHRKVRETVLRLNYSIEWIEYESIAKIGTGPNRNKTFLVPLYGGVWHVCMDISGNLSSKREDSEGTCQKFVSKFIDAVTHPVDIRPLDLSLLSLATSLRTRVSVI